MKEYLVTTGLIFGVLAGLHIWKAVAEWPQPTANLWYVLGMGALVVVPGALSCWAWQLLRALKNPRPKT